MCHPLFLLALLIPIVLVVIQHYHISLITLYTTPNRPRLEVFTGEDLQQWISCKQASDLRLNISIPYIVDLNLGLDYYGTPLIVYDVNAGFTKHAKLNISDKTLVHVAAGEGDVEQVASHAKMDGHDSRDEVGRTPLHYAAENNRKNVICYLVDNGVDINAQDKCLDTALLIASRFGRKSAMTELLYLGADPNIKNSAGMTALHEVAWMSSNLNLVYYFKLHNADINAQDVNLDTPLHYAVNYGNHRMIQAFSRNGADPNLTNNQGMTALHCAVQLNDTVAIQLLLNYGAEIGIKDFANKTPLDYAPLESHEALSTLVSTEQRRMEIANISGSFYRKLGTSLDNPFLTDFKKQIIQPFLAALLNLYVFRQLAEFLWWLFKVMQY